MNDVFTQLLLSHMVACSISSTVSRYKNVPSVCKVRLQRVISFTIKSVCLLKGIRLDRTVSNMECCCMSSSVNVKKRVLINLLSKKKT